MTLIRPPPLPLLVEIVSLNIINGTIIIMTAIVIIGIVFVVNVIVIVIVVIVIKRKGKGSTATLRHRKLSGPRTPSGHCFSLS